MLLIFSNTKKATSSSGSGTTTPNITASESFPGANGSSWPAQWAIVNASGTNTLTQQNGMGRIVTAAAAYGTARAFLNGMTAQTDTDVTMTFTVASQVAQYINLAVDADNTTWGSDLSYTQNGFFAYLSVSTTPGSSVLKLQKNVSSTQTNLASNVTVTVTAGTAYKLRLQRIGSLIQAKLWIAAQPEPTSWNISANNTGGVPPAGRVALIYQGNATTTSQTADFDDIAISDGTTVTTKGQAAYYNGTTTVVKPVKVWTGSAWVKKNTRFWDGTQWRFTYDSAVVTTIWSEYEDPGADYGTYLGNVLLESAGDPGTYVIQEQASMIEDPDDSPGIYRILTY